MKKKYVKPELINLNYGSVHGNCIGGSIDDNNCEDGGQAVSNCTQHGTTAGSNCYSHGSTAESYCYTLGNFPVSCATGGNLSP